PRRLRTGFAVADTNFADRASFPMFVTNALTWLAGELPAVLRPLGTVSVPLERARVVALDGTPQPTRSIPGATLITSDAPAFYTADNATARVRVVTHVLDPAVTDVNASTLSAVATGQSAAPTTSYWRRPAVWMLLLGAGLLLMAVEWWTYHRRLTL
ncbi:MAG: hypothetical protein KIT73_17640, partial [Burkholderiales bacterium]|nr:hypothetical protein [Burkholderiales bacterium]